MRKAKEIVLSKWAGPSEGGHALPIESESYLAANRGSVKAPEKRSNFSGMNF